MGQQSTNVGHEKPHSNVMMQMSAKAGIKKFGKRVTRQ